MKKFLLQTSVAFLFFVSACAGEPAATQEETVSSATAVSEEDPCSPQNLPNTVQPVNDLMREFDDASQLPANVPAQQLADIISNLQQIRRDTEDIKIPSCLTTLKTHQLNHMNLMIKTLLAFVGGADKEALNNGLEQARKEHDLYALEIVRLLGITLAPILATPEGTGAP